MQKGSGTKCVPLFLRRVAGDLTGAVGAFVLRTDSTNSAILITLADGLRVLMIEAGPGQCVGLYKIIRRLDLIMDRCGSTPCPAAEQVQTDRMNSPTSAGSI